MQTSALRRTLSCWLSALLLLGSSLTWANVAGQVIMVQGQALARSADGSERPLQRRSEIFASDTLITGADSRLQIRFVDSALLSLHAGSQLNVHEYRLGQEPGQDGKVLLELVEGGFRTLTGSIGKGNREAYQVNTPVASIGIRGTHYSMALLNNLLLAGVWQGGINLQTPQGSFNLGDDSPFSFGQISSAGFQGLLQPPAALTPTSHSAPAPGAGNNDESAPGSAQMPDTSLPPANDPVSGALGALPPPAPVIQINPFDQTSDPSYGDQIIMPGDPGDGSNPPPPPPPVISRDSRMSDAEYLAFLSSRTAGSIIINGRMEAAAVFTGDQDETVFVILDENNSTDLIRYYGDTTTPVAYPVDGGETAPGEGGDDNPLLILPGGISWGIWNGTSETPVKLYGERNSTDYDSIEGPVYWVTADPVRQANIPTTGSASFAGNLGIGSDSYGNNLTHSNGGFGLNFESGAVTGGYLYADYAGATTDTISWGADFEGSIQRNGVNTAVVQLDITGGYVEGPDGFTFSGGSIGGLLTAPDAHSGPNAFVGGFNLYATDIDNNQYNASGIVIWENTDLNLPTGGGG